MTVLKFALGEFLQRRHRFLVAQQVFGVMMISGLRNGRIICRRSRWNICTGVEGTHT